MKIQSLFLLGVSLALGASMSFAQRASQFAPFEGDGYFWYKVDPDPEPVEKTPPPKPVDAPSTPAEKKLKPMSAEWIRANMPVLLDKATDNPTPENVANYMYAQRIVLDKSQRFSQQVRDTVATDPFLDENNRLPLAQFAQIGFMRDESKAKEAALTNLASKSGIWVFVDNSDKCSACKNYVDNIIQSKIGGIRSKYDFQIRIINVNTTDGRNAAANLNLKVTPTTVLVVPPDGYFLVSQGLMSVSRLEDSLLIAARVKNLVPANLLEKANPNDQGLIETIAYDGFSPSSDPSEVLSAFRKKLSGVTE